MSTSKTRNNEQQGVTNPERRLIGDSQSMKDVEEDIRLSAKAEITVLITGESGVGKELVAQEIHHRSGRAWGPFKTINCGSLTESLLESRLFGHVKGSFTGAAGNQSGLFEAASGGTILLDEIGDMPMHLQVYLLRVLQERTILPVGSNAERKVDVRVIAATNKDLQREAREGRFRQDLYYRLNQFHIRVPALREHSCDIPILIRHFLDPLEIEEGALALLCRYPWPGNVRELKATVDRLALRAADGGAITTGQVWRDLGPITAEGAAADGHSGKRRDVITYAGELHKGDSVDEHFDRQKLAVYKELVKSAGSYSNAAKWLGMKPQTLHNRIRRLKR
jgi:transcriptional regulator with GAF, ATPase, and Fis domain